jgi:hypothetical protein
MKSFLLSLMALVFLVSCQQILSDSAMESIEKQIADITDFTLNSFNERDTANAYASYSDNLVALSTGELRITPDNWEEYKAKGKESVATRPPVTYQITESRIDVLSPTVANHHFIYNRKTVVAEDMSFETPVACTWTYVLEGNEWKIRNAHISYPQKHFRAIEGDTIFLAFQDIKADKKEEYERLAVDMLLDRMSETEQQAQYISNMVRMFYPAEANEDGTYTYLFMFDPMYTGNYAFNTRNLYTQIYGEERGKELDEQFVATWAGDQRSYFMIQSKK